MSSYPWIDCRSQCTRVAASPSTKKDAPSFPREALRANIQKGKVNAILTIDEQGNVADVKITASEPPRVFDRVVRDTLVDWKCAGEGAKYQASVEINFTLRD